MEGVFEHQYCVQIDSNSWSYETDDYFYNPYHVCSEDCCYIVSPGFQKETITLVALWDSDSPSIIIENSNLDFSLDTANNVKPYYIFSSDEYSKVDYGNLYFVNSKGENYLQE